MQFCIIEQLKLIPTNCLTPNRESALDWIDSNQLGRRNLTPEQMSLLRGRRYNRIKHQGFRSDLTLDQNDPKLSTAETLSKQHGVSPATIKRDGSFASDVERLKEIVPGFKVDFVSS